MTTAQPAWRGTEREVALVRQLTPPVVVVVSRCGLGWLGEVAALATQLWARSLVGLDRRLRTLFGIESVDYQFHTGDAELDRLVWRIRAARQAARRHEERAQQLTEQALQLPAGGTVRDLGMLLGISHQRVHQLLQRYATRLSTVEAEA
jgi:hypothetical protein